MSTALIRAYLKGFGDWNQRCYGNTDSADSDMDDIPDVSDEDQEMLIGSLFGNGTFEPER